MSDEFEMEAGRWYAVVMNGEEVSVPMRCTKVTEGVPELCWSLDLNDGTLEEGSLTYPPDSDGLYGGYEWAEVQPPAVEVGR